VSSEIKPREQENQRQQEIERGEKEKDRQQQLLKERYPNQFNIQQDQENDDVS
jgi:uncharacterized protein Veg